LAHDRAETTNLASTRPNEADKLATLWESQWAQFQKDARLPENK
jgi:hypothetical protein